MIYYVDAAAFKDGDGTKNRPFKHINDAAKIAVAGDEVIVKRGIYREHVVPVNAGTKDAPIIYRSEEPLGAVITGAEKVTNWTKTDGSVYKTVIKNSIFGDYNPYIERVYGDWYFSPIIRHTGSVFVNNQMMYEASSLEECQKGIGDPLAWDQNACKYLWFTEQSGDETVIYANFQDLDPNKENVEISVRRNVFMPTKNHVDYITVSGFNINKAATTWAPPAAYQDGMIGPHWSKGWIIEDCEIY